MMYQGTDVITVGVWQYGVRSAVGRTTACCRLLSSSSLMESMVPGPDCLACWGGHAKIV
jgi:hypothetical protein